MIDWLGLVFGSLWILGLALILGIFSVGNSLAYHEKQPLRRVIERPESRVVFYFGLSLFSLGFGASASSFWENILWGALALIFAFETLQIGSAKWRLVGKKTPAPSAAIDLDHPVESASESLLSLGDRGCVNLLGISVGTLSVEQLVGLIVETVRIRRKAYFAYVNAYAVNLALESPWFRSFLNNAAMTYCDGFGVKWGARLLGISIPHRYTPPDWLPLLLGECAHQDFSLFLLGARPGVAERAGASLRRRFPDLNIAGTHDGFFDKTCGSAENEAVIQSIATVRPDILIVGFGMPLQERWLAENWERIEAKAALPTGALIDYLAGEVPRAPHWMTDHGLEWLGRLVVEPHRLWRRYLVGIPQFLWRILVCRLGRFRFERL